MKLKKYIKVSEILKCKKTEKGYQVPESILELTKGRLDWVKYDDLKVDEKKGTFKKSKIIDGVVYVVK